MKSRSPNDPGSAEQRGFYKLWYRLTDTHLDGGNAEARAAAMATAHSGSVWRMLRDMPVGMVLYDERFRIVYQNPASEAMTGFPTDEFAGRSPIGLWIRTDERAHVERHLRKMQEERVALRGRGVHARRDGSRSWIEWYTTPLFNGERFAGYLGLHTNLSEEVHAAKRQAELLVDAAVDLALIPVSPAGLLQSWNRNAAALFHREAGDALDAPFEALFDASGSPEERAQEMLAASVRGERAEFEGWLSRPSTGRFWGHVRLYPQRDEEGTTRAHTLVARDLSERRLAEEKLREHEALLNAIVTAASDAILGIDATGRVVLANPAARRLFGMASNERESAALREFLVKADLERPADGPRTLSVRSHDDRVLHLEVSAACTSMHGAALSTLVVRDATERIESEQALHRYREQLSALAHDLMEAEQKTSRRLAQVLHDHLGQTFTSLRIFHDALRARLGLELEAPLERTCESISALIDRGMREIRNVLVELRPALLEEQGLPIALDNEVQTQAGAHPEAQVSFRCAPGAVKGRWEADVEYAAFMIAREAVGNALRHARCAEVRVTLERWGLAGFRLAIRDDGDGVADAGKAAKPGHLGMIGMRERALGIGGQLHVGPAEGGRGTAIELRYAG